MTTRRRLPGVFIAAFIAGLLWSGLAHGLPSSFLIEGADETRYESLPPSSTLNSLLDALGPHFVVDMADTLGHARLLAAPAALALDSLPVHFVLDMADSNLFTRLAYPEEVIGDTAPPQEEGTPEIVPVASDIIKIRWKTNEFSQGTVEFGTQSGQYAHSVSEPLYVKDHEVTLTGLSPEGQYFYRLSNIDPAGNVGYGPEQSFSLAGPESKSLYLPLTIDR